MIRITTFSGKTIAVFGLARSGIVAAEALRAGGAKLACWDDGAGGRAAAEKAGLELVDLNHADWSQFAALVLAPGVPLTHPKPHWTVEKAKAAGVEIIGDIELFFRERAKTCPACPVVAITGTNGKSTTTALIAHILRAAGKDVQMGGNIGVGVLSLEAPAPDRYFVIEMSSFQIDLTPTLNPTVGVLLNITPDHLDRHGTMENYAAIKARILAQAEVAIVSTDDSYCAHIFAGFDRWSTRVIDISTETAISWEQPEDRSKSAPDFPLLTLGHSSVIVADGSLFVRTEHKFHGDATWTPVADLTKVGSLRGSHNGQNAAAAFAACAKLRVPAATIATALGTFPGLAHRLEELGHVGRAVVVNDSKGTNADSTEKALASFPGDIYWIAGGLAKEGGIESLAPYFDRVAKAYLIGQSAPEFARTLEGRVPYEISGTLETATASAVRDAALSKAAEPVILLSPACASYDQYKSFEHRGDHFRALASAMPGFTRKGHA